MSEQRAPGGGWDKANELLGKAKDAAATGAKKAQEMAQAGMGKAQQIVDDMEKKAADAKAAKVTSGGWDGATETASYVPQGSGSQRGVLVDPSEQIVATIGSGYLQNFLSGGGVGKGIGVLTNKRFYYKGKNFSGKGKEATATSTEGVVALEDVTYTQFDHTRHIGLLIAAIILAVVGVMCAVIFYRYSEIFFGIGLVAALVFAVMFFVNRQTLFTVCFGGGRFGFDIRYYPIADIRDFQRQLHLMKDHIKEGGAK